MPVYNKLYLKGAIEKGTEVKVLAGDYLFVTSEEDKIGKY